jgi:hypothetical protein
MKPRGLETLIDDAITGLRELANQFVQWIIRQHIQISSEEKNIIMANGVKSTLELITSLPPDVLKGVAEGRLSLALSFDNQSWDDGTIEWRPNLSIKPVIKPEPQTTQSQPGT